MTVTVFPSSQTSFRLPSGLEDLSGYPLYLVVATWGLRQGCVLTTVTVSRTFFISQGQARDALHYISHEGQSRIISEQVPVLNGTHPFCKGVRVMAVNLANVTLNEKEKTKQDGAERQFTNVISTRVPRSGSPGDTSRELRRWMVSRRCGEAVPVHLLAGEGAD